jgi:acetyl-CoA carboxylase carboxyltransferase component
MGPQQLAGVMSIVGPSGGGREGPARTTRSSDAAMRAMVEQEIEKAVDRSWPMSGRVYDDGVIDPRDTRTVLGLCLWLVSRRTRRPTATPASACSGCEDR